MFFINFKSPLIVHLGVLLFLSIILFFSNLGATPFFNKGEPREAVIVQDIVLHGNWLFPKRMGSGIPSKPPLFHWVGALISIMRGRVTEVTTRFPSAMFATLGILLLYGLGRKIYNPAIGLLAGVILATSLDYSRLAIAARVDMTLTFFLSLGLALFYLLYSDQLKGTLWPYLFYLVIGVGILAKGPVSLVLTGMTIVVFLGIRRRWDYLYRLCFHWGALLTVGVALFWYGMAIMHGGEEFIGRQIINENLARFFSYGETGTGHQKPIYYYFPYLFFGGLPWSLLFPFVVAELFRGKRFSDEGTLFMVVWVVVVFTFFSLSEGKRSPYIMPLFLPVSLLTAAWFMRSVTAVKWEITALRALSVISLLVALIFVVSIPKAVWEGEPMWFLSALLPLLKSIDQAKLWIVKEEMARAGWFFVLFLLLSSLLWLSLGRSLWNLQIRSLPWNLAGIAILSWLLAQSVVLPALAGARSYGPFMLEVNRVTDGSQLYLYARLIDPNPLIFYRGSVIPLVEGSPRDVAHHLWTSGDYFIMGEKAWVKIRGTLEGFQAPLLRSKATGPDGKARLVLVRGARS